MGTVATTVCFGATSSTTVSVVTVGANTVGVGGVVAAVTVANAPVGVVGAIEAAAIIVCDVVRVRAVRLICVGGMPRLY